MPTKRSIEVYLEDGQNKITIRDSGSDHVEVEIAATYSNGSHDPRDDTNVARHTWMVDKDELNTDFIEALDEMVNRA